MTLLLLFTFGSLLLFLIFTLFCSEFFRCFSIRHIGSSFLSQPIKSNNLEKFQPMKRWRCSQSNYSELQGRRALAEAQRFVYKQLTPVASVMDVEMPARYFFSEVVDCYHDFDGECEDCGLIVPEWSLLQCQYGFCGKFFCQNCGFRCRRCGDYESRAVSLCSSHARLVYPSCDGCKNQFCDVCTDISVTQVSRKNVLSLYTVTWRITV